MKYAIFVIIAIITGVLVYSFLTGSTPPRSPEPPRNPQPREPVPKDPPKQEPTSLPDLVITEQSWTPNSPIVTPGTTIRFFIKVENHGNASTTGGIRVVGTNGCEGFVSGGLSVREAKIAEINCPLHTPGATYGFTFTVDNENTIKESNERNNYGLKITIKTSY